LTAEQCGGMAVIRVKDNGIGLPTDMLHHIFEMFTQVKGPLDRPQGGLGIGLALVRNLVEMHGGTVEAKSDGDGLGSEFIVRLPLETAHEEQYAQEDDSRVVAQTPSRQILLADDNEDAATSLAMLLRLSGHKVHVAHDGQVALELAKSSKPEIAILDIQMPDMDGHEVARRLRQQPGLEKVILVALTGYGQPEDRLRSQAAGFTHHLTKPVDPKLLHELIASCDDGQQLQFQAGHGDSTEVPD
jgi:CheY-like chemotaxis protein